MAIQIASPASMAENNAGVGGNSAKEIIAAASTAAQLCHKYAVAGLALTVSSPLITCG
jgi:hypothetical protein